MKTYLQQLLGLVLVGCMASNSFAIGGGFIGNEVPSARAVGEGFVGTAGQNDDPTAVYTNPAAMTALPGTQATFGITWENIHGEYQDSSGNDTKERVTNAGVPNMAVTQNFMDGKLAAGLSTQSPFGLETYWPENSPLRYVATDSRLDLVDITPAVAYQVHPMVSVGAGADYINVFNATLNRAVNVNGVNSSLGAPTTTSPDGSSSLNGQAASWGYHAGVVFKPTEQHAFGITYHSKVDLQVNGSVSLAGMSGAMAGLFGGSNFSTSAYTDLILPENVQFGYAFKPNDKWIFEADMSWYHWSAEQDLNIRYPAINPNTLQGATQLAILNQGNPTPLNPRDAWGFAAGANYKATDRLQVRSGFFYVPSAVPQSDFSPAFMDLDRYGITVGAGYALTERLGIDVAYNAIFTHSETVTNNVGANTTGNPAYNINGNYSDFANLVAVNLTYRFGNAAK